MINLTEYARENLLYWIDNHGGRKAFVDETKISQANITRIFQEKRMSPKDLKKICDRYGVTANEFLNSYLFKTEDISKIFYANYYAYFSIHHIAEIFCEAVLSIKGNTCELVFKDEYNEENEIKLIGEMQIDDNFFCFNLKSFNSDNKYHGFMMLSLPNIGFDDKYHGGIGYLCLPMYQNTVLSMKKILLSKNKFNLTNKDEIDFKMLCTALHITKGNMSLISFDEERKITDYILKPLRRHMIQEDFWKPL